MKNHIKLLPGLGVRWVWLRNVQPDDHAFRIPGERGRQGQGVWGRGWREGLGGLGGVVEGLVQEELMRVVAHPLTTHDVEGRVRREASQVHSAIKQRHDVWNMTTHNTE